jgi:hypothetical protein
MVRVGLLEARVAFAGGLEESTLDLKDPARLITRDILLTIVPERGAGTRDQLPSAACASLDPGP